MAKVSARKRHARTHAVWGAISHGNLTVTDICAHTKMRASTVRDTLTHMLTSKLTAKDAARVNVEDPECFCAHCWLSKKACEYHRAQALETVSG